LSLSSDLLVSKFGFKFKTCTAYIMADKLISYVAPEAGLYKLNPVYP
jgi:hypothetical protein